MDYAILEAFLDNWCVVVLGGAFSDNILSSLIYSESLVCRPSDTNTGELK